MAAPITSASDDALVRLAADVVAQPLSPAPRASAAGGDGPIADAEDAARVWVGRALEAALALRAPGLHASTPLVRQLAVKLSRDLGLDVGARRSWTWPFACVTSGWSPCLTAWSWRSRR